MSVYFAVCRDARAVKIGSSLDPHERHRELQRCCPLLITIEAMMPGNHEEEFALHRRFEEHRIRGEWFVLTDAIEALITANPALPPPTREERLSVTRAMSERPTAKMRAKEARLRERQLEARRESERRAGDRYLAKREARGDIIFPWRAEQTA